MNNIFSYIPDSYRPVEQVVLAIIAISYLYWFLQQFKENEHQEQPIDFKLKEAGNSQLTLLEQIEKNQQYLTLVGENISQALAIYDQNKQQVYANPAYLHRQQQQWSELTYPEVANAITGIVDADQNFSTLTQNQTQNQRVAVGFSTNNKGQKVYLQSTWLNFLERNSNQPLTMNVLSDQTESHFRETIRNMREILLSFLSEEAGVAVSLQHMMTMLFHSTDYIPISLYLMGNHFAENTQYFGQGVDEGFHQTIAEELDLHLLLQSEVIRTDRVGQLMIKLLPERYHQFKTHCAELGIGSCWIQPIRSTNGECLSLLFVWLNEGQKLDHHFQQFYADSGLLISLLLQRVNSIRMAKQFESVIEASSSGILLLNAQGLIEKSNPALTQILGYQPIEIRGKSYWELQPDGDSGRQFYDLANALKKNQPWDGNLQVNHVDGRKVQIHAVLCPAKSKINNSVIIIDDLTELQTATQKVVNLSFYDPVTGLNNRALLFERLQHSLDSVIRKNTQLAAILIDLDRFKRINDSLGSDVGDSVLSKIALRIQEAVRKEDIIARMDSDLFAVIVTGFEEATLLRTMVEKLLYVIEQPLEIDDKKIVITASAGIGIGPDDGQDAKELIRKVSMALYRAKINGRHQFEFYEYELNKSSRQKFNLETEMRLGIERNEFFVMYQPIVNSLSGQVISAEALLRWKNPLRGMVSPLEFIPIAEETGLIIPLGDLVIKKTVELLSSLGEHAVKIGVNLSVKQFHDRNLSENIGLFLEEKKIDKKHFGLELTESLIMSRQGEGIEQLRKLKDMGLSIAIDDFGTGYSSLRYLTNFPVDTLKIDRSFIQDLPKNDKNRALVEAMVAIAQKLNLSVVAEGVETMAEFTVLRNLHCQELSIQGFLFSKPLIAQEFSQLILNKTSYQVVA